MRRISLAWMAISDAWPDAPPEGSARNIQHSASDPDKLRTVDHDARVGQTMPFPPFPWTHSNIRLLSRLISSVLTCGQQQ